MRQNIALLVCGGRDYQDRECVFRVLDLLHQRLVVKLIVHGACGLNADRPGSGAMKGADRWADEWAVERGVEIHRYPAAWSSQGKRAGFVRNAMMLGEKLDGVVAFPGGNGTADMARRAEEKGLPVWRVTPGWGLGDE